YVAVLGILSTSIATIIFYNLIKIKDTVFASLVTYLMPIVAVSVGVIDGENINSIQLLGMVLIILGVFISGKKIKSLKRIF
ncbi:MAG: EamA family transporter, partial [Marinoscillum sp.]